MIIFVNWQTIANELRLQIILQTCYLETVSLFIFFHHHQHHYHYYYYHHSLRRKEAGHKIPLFTDSFSLSFQLLSVQP